MYYGNNVGIVPLTDAAGITQPFKPGVHKGVDIGWNKQYNCSVLAWQDGKVINKGYFSDTGYWVALEHTYGNVKRWTCYIHLQSAAPVSVGQNVVLGQKIGNRGNTGKSTGEHLHMYLTSQIAKNISFGNDFEVMKKYVVNPVPYLYYSKQFNTVYISKDWTKPLPDPIQEVVQPVERDPLKDQLICHTDDLRVRTGASLTKTVIGHLQKDKYYNWLESVENEGYAWFKLANNQWCAKIDEVEILPHTEIVQPVDRDERKDQLTCSVDNLRIRTLPSLKGQQLGFLKKDAFYDWFSMKKADNYEWYELAADQWCARVEEVTILPKIEYYTAQEGDTIESIAAKFNTTTEKVVSLNPQLVKPGDVLRVQ